MAAHVFFKKSVPETKTGGISYTASNPHLMGVSAGSYSLAELMFPTLCVGSDLLKCIRWLLDWSCKSYWYCLESCEFGGTACQN